MLLLINNYTVKPTLALLAFGCFGSEVGFLFPGWAGVGMSGLSLADSTVTSSANEKSINQFTIIISLNTTSRAANL